jgi:hypothetical protein
VAFSPHGTGPVETGSRRGASSGSRTTHQAVQIVGLAQFRRDLAKIDKDLSKEINKYFRELGRTLRDEARRRAPVGGTGALRKSIKHSVKAKEMSLFSDLVYARAHEWGTSGTAKSAVQPRGVPIKIRKTQMLGHTVFRNADRIEEHLGGLVDHLAQINGFDD